jgi:pilus assembly protein CpaB
MSRRGLLIVMILVLGLGLAAGALVMRQSAQTAKVMEKKEKTVKIVVVAKALSRGVRVKQGDLKLREWPERLATEDYIRNMKEAMGRVVVSKTIPGEPLLRAKLAPVDSAEGLSTLIPYGRRAFALRVTEVTGVAGFLLPGSRVDVHATFKVKQPKGNTDVILTKTILEDVEVLAAGGEKQAGQKKGRIKVPVVTLLLTPKESDKLALAATASESIWLSMRKPRDNDKRKKLNIVTINQILKFQKKKKKTPKVAKRPVRKKAKRRTHVVEIYQGSKRSIARF